MDKASYALGLNIGQQLKQMGLSGILNIEDFAASIKDTLEGNELKMPLSEAQQVLNAFFGELETKQRAAAAEAGKAARAEGEQFLADNAKREGITVTATGLQYEILTEGSGKQPKASDTVRCHYEGRLINGNVFDSSYRRGEPADFGLMQVIKGWTEGVQLMKEGSKFRFYIHYNLAYGEHGAGSDIPPFAALIFDVELIKVL